MIAIIAASKQETKEFLKRIIITDKAKVCKKRVYLGNLEGKEIIIGISGIGEENAKKFLNALLDKFKISLLISVGFCGALNQTLKVGDIVIGQNLSRIGNATLVPGTSVAFSQHPYQVPVLWPDKNLVGGALRAATLSNKIPYPYKVQFGTIHHVDHIVEAASEKAKLRELTGADAIDMESYPLAEMAQAKGIPFLTIRSVSDEAGHNLNVGFQKFINSSKGLSPFKAAWHLLTHPRASFNVFRLQKNSRHATKTLAAFLETHLRFHNLTAT